MRQPADGARLVQPLRHGRRVGIGIDDLDGHLALQARVVAQPHGGLGAAPELAAKLEAADTLASGGTGERHASARSVFGAGGCSASWMSFNVMSSARP